jgi:hypothetical protein
MHPSKRTEPKPLDYVVEEYVCKPCDICARDKLFTGLIPKWSPTTHWFFKKEEKQIVKIIMLIRRFGDSILSTIPKDVVLIIISHLIKVNHIRELVRKFRSRCDECLIRVMKQPQCGYCVRMYRRSIGATISFTYGLVDGYHMTQCDVLCSRCKIQKIYECSVHPVSYRGKLSALCEYCVRSSQRMKCWFNDYQGNK